MLTLNPILTKDSCGSEGSNYRRTRNGGLYPTSALLFGLKNGCFQNESLSFSDHNYPTWERTTNVFYLLNRVLWSVCDPFMPKESLGWSRRSYGVEMMGLVHGFSFLFICRISLKRLEGDSASSCSQGPTWSSSPDISHEGTLGEPPTPTIVHVRSIKDLTNCPSYLLYVLYNPSLSQ